MGMFDLWSYNDLPTDMNRTLGHNCSFTLALFIIKFNFLTLPLFLPVFLTYCGIFVCFINSYMHDVQLLSETRSNTKAQTHTHTHAHTQTHTHTICIYSCGF